MAATPKKGAAPSKHTASDVAQWMLKAFEEKDGTLEQWNAVCGIENEFGEPFVYLNKSANLAIAKNVLTAFGKLTPDVVWSNSEKAWRRREPDDDPGRNQA